MYFIFCGRHWWDFWHKSLSESTNFTFFLCHSSLCSLICTLKWCITLAENIFIGREQWWRSRDLVLSLDRYQDLILGVSVSNADAETQSESIYFYYANNKIAFIFIFSPGWLWFCQEDRSRTQDLDVLWYTGVCRPWDNPQQRSWPLGGLLVTWYSHVWTSDREVSVILLQMQKEKIKQQLFHCG